jgi:two-component system, OmpR family, phosphate regulon sensor histidine kinase PhoR
MIDAEEKKEILDLLAEGVAIVSKEGELISLNGAARRMLQLPQLGTLPVATLLERYHSPLLEKCFDLISGALKEKKKVTGCHFEEEGIKRYWELSAIFLASKEQVILVMLDASSQYKTLEVGKDFIANASHELRTPITIIKGFTETLLDIPNLSAEMFRIIIDKILRSCQRMEVLIKNLLTLSDIEHLASSRFKECGLLPMIIRAKETLLTVHPSTVFRLSVDRDDLLLNADFDLIELALANLFENAVKYSPKPAHISVAIKSEGKRVKVAISDKGVGIAEKDLEYIFERFYTVNKAHSRRLGGAGLGLSLVKLIIEKHGGSISVQSTVGKGTMFTLDLPVLGLVVN